MRVTRWSEIEPSKPRFQAIAHCNRRQCLRRRFNVGLRKQGGLAPALFLIEFFHYVNVP